METVKKAGTETFDWSWRHGQIKNCFNEILISKRTIFFLKMVQGISINRPK